MTDLRTPAQETALKEHVELTRQAHGMQQAQRDQDGNAECPRHGKTLRHAEDAGGVLEFWFEHLECPEPGCGYEVWA